MYHPKLYDRQSIYEGYDYRRPETFPQSYDQRVYQHYVSHGKSEPHNIQESLARRIHDHSITDALHDFAGGYPDKRIVAIMGGHGLPRGSEDYTKVALIARELARKGYLMISGGGPGAMEATHVGAWFAGRQKRQLLAGIRMLSKAPHYDPQEAWLRKAFEVMERYPLLDDTESLGVPTWLYGHEPPTPFATRIAKYFANSVREEGLLALAKGGVIFSPGSAGTIQEIFQDACQNHYVSYEHPSPMVFLNREYWTATCPVYPFLEDMTDRGRYNNLLLSLHDDVDGVVKEIFDFS
jgi:predicted Rossmann-fold nucleotide-binding protein